MESDINYKHFSVQLDLYFEIIKVTDSKTKTIIIISYIKGTAFE
jgi:hypothetical protein